MVRAAHGSLIVGGLVVAASALAAGSAPDQEIIPPTEAADSATVIQTIENGVHTAYVLGLRPAKRDAHAKGHGCVRGEFTVSANLPAALRVGVFAEPKTYTAWIRFSNGSGTPHDDHSGDGRGMAVKLTGVPGKKLLANEINADTQDFLMINYPVFFIRNVAEYVPFTGLSLQGNANEYFASHPKEKEIVDAVTAKTIDAVFEQRYFSMAPYLLRDNYMKFSARPVDCTSGAPIVQSLAPKPKGDSDYLREGMVKWLDQKDACFKFSIQLQTDPTTQPIEDPTVLWDEAKAPFVDVASIRIPRQTFDSEAQQTFCENLSFTPWHSLPEQRPVGGINRLRKALYQAISELRHKLNGAPWVEPTGNETFN
jgi:hypothetical protein